MNDDRRDGHGRRELDDVQRPSKWPPWIQLAITVGVIVWGSSAIATTAMETRNLVSALTAHVEQNTQVIYMIRSDVDVLKCRDGITCNK